MTDIRMKRGDREPSVTATLKAAGVAIDLTGGSVKFLMRNRATAAVKVNASCVIVTAASGIVRYDWGATDTDTVGTYDVEFEITRAGGNKITVPNDGFYEAVVFEDIA